MIRLNSLCPHRNQSNFEKSGWGIEFGKTTPINRTLIAYQCRRAAVSDQYVIGDK